MKKTYLLSLLLGLVAVPALQAIQVYTTPSQPWRVPPGGELTLRIDSGLNTDGYSSFTKNQVVTPSFQTFCVEGNEGIEFGKTYTGVLNDQTLNTGKALTVGVAWLYCKFATGGLADYDYDDNGVGRLTSAALLQHTLWALLGEEGQVDNNSTFDALVKAEFGSWANAQAPAGVNNYGVSIVNLYEIGDTQNPRRPRQDVLWYNAPDGGLTIMLLGMGLSGLAFMSRRIRG